jgi:predicted nucleic acid-binding protein
MYLVDTNIWLERLLNQERSDEVGRFLDLARANDLHITDFTLHSIGIILTKLRQPKVFVDFVKDILIDSGVNLVRVEPEAVRDLVSVIGDYHLDFDDGYQYLAAQQNDLILVSFDTDFDRTDWGRRTPKDVLSDIRPPIESS